NITQGALVAIDPTAGAIIAMVGSANPNAYGGQYNLAVWPPRNPGSSMKIFTYTAAIASGKYTMTTPIVDSRFSYREPGSTEVYAPQNYDGRLHGTCQLQACMGNSLNIPAVKVELGIGVSTVVAMARAMGAPPYQLHGTDANGFPNYTTDDPVHPFGPSLPLRGRHVGVKTGTSDSFADAWTVGYTPHLVTAVWGGNANWNVKMTKGSDSYYIAAPMWHTFMQQALDTMGMGDEWYPEPPGLIH